jgi:hypothetical protein
MPDCDFDMLRTQLLQSGVKPGHVARLIAELTDHYEDIESEAVRAGCSLESARTQARTRMGDTDQIARQVLSEPDLKCWFYRRPQLARLVLPLIYVLLLPAAPIYAGAAHASVIGRWLACLALSGLVTGTMFLLMQLAIVFS